MFLELLYDVLVLFLYMKVPSCFGLKQGEAQDYLFIATERYKFCVLQWDTETSELVTRYAWETAVLSFLMDLLMFRIIFSSVQIEINILVLQQLLMFSGHIPAASCG